MLAIPMLLFVLPPPDLRLQDVSLLASDSVVFEEGFEREDALPKRKAAAPFKRAARALLVAGHMSGGLFE